MQTCHVKVRTFGGEIRTVHGFECTRTELDYFRRGAKMYLSLDGMNIWARAESISPTGDISAFQVEDDGNHPLYGTEPGFED